MRADGAMQAGGAITSARKRDNSSAAGISDGAVP